jgi:hypothetical protein
MNDIFYIPWTNKYCPNCGSENGHFKAIWINNGDGDIHVEYGNLNTCKDCDWIGELENILNYEEKINMLRFKNLEKIL